MWMKPYPSLKHSFLFHPWCHLSQLSLPFFSISYISVGKVVTPILYGDPVTNSILFIRSYKISCTGLIVVSISTDHTYRIEGFSISLCMVTAFICKYDVTNLYHYTLSTSYLNFMMSALRCMVSVIDIVLRFSIPYLDCCAIEAPFFATWFSILTTSQIFPT